MGQEAVVDVQDAISGAPPPENKRMVLGTVFHPRKPGTNLQTPRALAGIIKVTRPISHIRDLEPDEDERTDDRAGC